MKDVIKINYFFNKVRGFEEVRRKYVKKIKEKYRVKIPGSWFVRVKINVK